MITILYRGNESGEILDASGQVIGQIVSPSHDHFGTQFYVSVPDLSAAAVRVPERRTQSEDERYHPDAHYECGLTDGFNECLDALGVQP